MSWLERARREIPNCINAGTAKTAESGLSSVTAVMRPIHFEKKRGNESSGMSNWRNSGAKCIGKSPAITAESQAEDLAERFTERCGILQFDAGLTRDVAQTEAARMTATLARNRAYSWAALRLAFRDYPAILALLPDRPGVVDSLPLGVAKLAIHPRYGVMPQGIHRVRAER